MTNKIKILGYLVLITSILIGCKSSNKREKEIEQISIRLPIPIVDGAFAPFYIGQDKGIFEKNGLKVKLEPGSPELNPVKMVSQNKDEFGILGGPELLITGKSQGVDITGIALMHKNSDFVVILTKKNSQYQSLKDLNNKKVGFFYGHISTDVIRSLFLKENINVEEVDVGFNYNLFIADKIPAQWAFRTTAGLTLPEKGINLDMISPAEYGIKTHGHTIITNSKNIQSNPELVDKFIKSLVEAINYSLNHMDEAIQSVKSRDKNLSESLIRKQLEIYNTVIQNNDKVGWIDTETLIETKERLVRLNQIDESLQLDSTINNSFIKAYYSQENTE